MEARSILEDLLVDEDKLTDELVKNSLAPHLGLSKSSDQIVPKPGFSELPQPTRILLYLVSRYAATKLKLPGASLSASVDKISENCMIPIKSCREILSRLKGTGLISKDQGGYLIPVHSLLRVTGELNKTKKG